MTVTSADPFPDHRLSLRGIEEAYAVIDPSFLNSKQFSAGELDRQLGRSVLLKDETDNEIASFKGRGADYFLHAITRRGDDRDLVCASTGNFGQAMAWAAAKRERRVIVYADERANQVKTGRIAELGGEVRLAGDDFDAAKDIARSYCDATGAWMIEDGREPEISEGAGTIGLELAVSTSFDAVILPVGNGALINGVARWLKAASPKTRVVGVSARGADAMEVSWRSPHLVEQPSVQTIAEGIAVRTPVPEAVEDMRPLVDEMLLVTDDEMIDAMRLIFDTTGHVVEPAAVAGVAALMTQGDAIEGDKVATVLTGSNVTEEQRRRWLG